MVLGGRGVTGERKPGRQRGASPQLCFLVDSPILLFFSLSLSPPFSLPHSFSLALSEGALMRIPLIS